MYFATTRLWSSLFGDAFIVWYSGWSRMFNRYTCRIEKEEFIGNSLSSLSPFLDLPSYVEAEKKCESNIYDRGETKKMRDVDVLLPVWNSVTKSCYIVSGKWMRQWVHYIFVCQFGIAVTARTTGILRKG